jgi:hypothetical protein
MTTTMTDTLTTVADATLKLCEVLEAGYIRWSPDSKFPPKYTISAGKLQQRAPDTTSWRALKPATRLPVSPWLGLATTYTVAEGRQPLPQS